MSRNTTDAIGHLLSIAAVILGTIAAFSDDYAKAGYLIAVAILVRPSRRAA